jgi:hypothetical protein
MTPENDPIDSGARLGADAVEHVNECATRYCDAECERVALVNGARIGALHAEGRDLADRRAGLRDRLRSMVPPGGGSPSRRRVAWYWTVGAFLTLAAFGFSIIGFSPFHLGMVGLLYCAGIALVTPFAADEFLRVWRTEVVVKVAITTAFAAAMIGGGLLAAVRGEIFARTIHDSGPSVTIDGDTHSDGANRPSFYDETEVPLRLLMLLFALAFDLAAGVAFHRARQEKPASDGAYAVLTRELSLVQTRISEVVFEITLLTNAPGIVRNTFWRDFYRAILTQTARKAVRKGVTIMALAFMLLPRIGFSAGQSNIVIAVDLSTSEAEPGADGTTPFAQNLAAVRKLLGAAPAGSRITIIRITENSIADPTPLLSASVGVGDDQFGDRLRAGRAKLARTWQARAASLQPSARGTDIIGALFLASDIFRQQASGGRNILVVFSDMRNATAILNLEVPPSEPQAVVFGRLLAQNRIPDLTGVTVYIAGANGGRTDLPHWQTTRNFWLEYCAHARARVAGYTMLSEPPALER